MEGREEAHNMVAYWNSCWPSHRHLKFTKIEPDRVYTDSQLWAKVTARGPAPVVPIAQDEAERLWLERKGKHL